MERDKRSSRLGFLPNDVADAVGLEQQNHDFEEPELRKQQFLAHMNDRGKTFLEIADYIEVNL